MHLHIRHPPTPPPSCHPRHRRDALARWAAYLHFRLAEYALTHEGPEAAGEALARMEPQAAEAAAAPAKGKGRGSAAAAAAAAGVQLSGVERVLHLLARATLHLCAGQHSEAGAAIEAANPLIEPAAGGDARLYAQLHAHYSLLLVCMVVLAGRVNDLQQGGWGGRMGGGWAWVCAGVVSAPLGGRMPVQAVWWQLACANPLPNILCPRCSCPSHPADPSGNIHSLVKLRKLLADAGSEPWAYAWLPPPALAAIGNLLHASLLRRCAGVCWQGGRLRGAALSHRRLLRMADHRALLLPCPAAAWARRHRRRPTWRRRRRRWTLSCTRWGSAWRCMG